MGRFQNWQTVYSEDLILDMSFKYPPGSLVEEEFVTGKGRAQSEETYFCNNRQDSDSPVNEGAGALFSSYLAPVSPGLSLL